MDRDRDLFAYLDDKFARIDRQFARIDRQFARIDSKFDGIDSRYAEMQDQIDRRFKETQDQIRHTNVVVEGLRSKIETVAEGHVLLDAKLDRIYEEIKTERRQDRAEFRAAIRELRRRDDDLEGRLERLEAASR